MKSEIHLSPETDEEVTLLEKLADAREYALEEAEMDAGSVAGIFAQMAAGIAGEEETTETPGDILTCPECETEVQNIEAPGIGESPTIAPCGCTVKWSDVPADYFD